jgi:hypothetical protein
MEAAGGSYAPTADKALLDFMYFWVLSEHLRKAAL